MPPLSSLSPARLFALLTFWPFAVQASYYLEITSPRLLVGTQSKDSLGTLSVLPPPQVSLTPCHRPQDPASSPDIGRG